MFLSERFRPRRGLSILLGRTLGEEESADFLLSEVAKPLVQQATLEDKHPVHVHTKKASA